MILSLTLPTPAFALRGKSVADEKDPNLNPTLAGLEEALQSGSPAAAVREAKEAALTLASAAGIPSTLPHPHSQLQTGLEETPAEVKIQKTVANLIRLLGSHNVDLRQEAVETLREMGPAAAPAVPALIDLLPKGYSQMVKNGVRHTGEAYWIRRLAAETLGEIGPPAAPAVPALAGLLREHDYHEVHLEVIRALGEIGPPAASAIPVLKGLLKDKNLPTSFLLAARLALQKIDSTAGLEEGEQFQQEVVAELRQMRDGAWGPLLDSLAAQPEILNELFKDPPATAKKYWDTWKDLIPPEIEMPRSSLLTDFFNAEGAVRRRLVGLEEGTVAPTGWGEYVDALVSTVSTEKDLASALAGSFTTAAKDSSHRRLLKTFERLNQARQVLAKAMVDQHRTREAALTAFGQLWDEEGGPALRVQLSSFRSPEINQITRAVDEVLALTKSVSPAAGLEEGMGSFQVAQTMDAPFLSEVIEVLLQGFANIEEQHRKGYREKPDYLFDLKWYRLDTFFSQRSHPGRYSGAVNPVGAPMKERVYPIELLYWWLTSSQDIQGQELEQKSITRGEFFHFENLVSAAQKIVPQLNETYGSGKNRELTIASAHQMGLDHGLVVDPGFVLRTARLMGLPIESAGLEEGVLEVSAKAPVNVKIIGEDRAAVLKRLLANGRVRSLYYITDPKHMSDWTANLHTILLKRVRTILLTGRLDRDGQTVWKPLTLGDKDYLWVRPEDRKLFLVPLDENTQAFHDSLPTVTAERVLQGRRIMDVNTGKEIEDFPEELKDAYGPDADIVVMDPLRLYYVPDEIGGKVAELLRIAEETLDGFPSGVSPTLLTEGMEPEEGAIIIRQSESTSIPNGEAWVAKNTAFIDFTEGMTLAEVIRQAFSYWRKEPIGKVLGVRQLEDGRLAIYV